MFKKILLELILPLIAVVSSIGLLLHFDYTVRKNKETNQLFEIIDIKTTQVIEVTFQNVNTTEMYKINFIKQYCSNWQAIELGSEWSLPIITNESGKYILNAHLICGN